MIEFIEDLTKIATPDAAKALVDFLWHTNESLRFKAAWNLAALFIQNDITEFLQEIKLTVEQKNSEYLDWIWQPFNDSSNGSLSIIAGRIVYLLDKTPIESIPYPLPQLDPRLIIPLLSIQNPVNFQDNVEWNSLAGSLLVQQEQTAEIEQKITEQINQILRTQFSNSPWKTILSSLKPRLQLDLLRRLINQRHPNVDDWRNLFLKIEYQFQYSYHYRLVLAVGIIASVVSIAEIILLLFAYSDKWFNGFLGLAIYVSLIFWISFVQQESEERLEADNFIQFGLLGIVTFGNAIRRLFKDCLVWIEIKNFYHSVTIAAAVAYAFASLATALFAVVAMIVAVAVAIAAAVAAAVAAVAAAANPGINIRSIYITAFFSFIAVAVVAAIVGETMTDRSDSTFTAAAILATVSAIAGFGVVAFVGFSTDAGCFARVGAFVASISAFIAIAVGVSTGAGAVFATPAALMGIGLGVWHRAKTKIDMVRFLAIFAFPYFCWFPIVALFSTLFMLRYLTWQYMFLIWVIVLGTCITLWIDGKNKERRASNPLKGILDIYL